MNTALKPPDAAAPKGRARAPSGPLAEFSRTARGHAGGAFARCLGAIRLGLLALLSSGPLAAQTLTDGGTRITAAGGREVIVLSAQAGLRAVAQVGFPRIDAQSHETATQRIHVVTVEGETYRAATALDGPGSRIVFDPVRRTFVPLLPSIRVELTEGVQIEALAARVEAVGVTVFESLGFAIVDLPEALHPADAVARVSNAFGANVASVRLRGPRIEWR